MAIAVDSIITASDILDVNLAQVTNIGDRPSSNNSGSENYSYTLYFRNSIVNNLVVDLDKSFQYKLQAWAEPERITLLFNWKGNALEPDVNTEGWLWETELDEDLRRLFKVSIPKDTEMNFNIRYLDAFAVPRPGGWTAICHQAQDDIEVGDPVRVWEVDWSTLLELGESTVITALADAGRLGTE